jgi:branched-chain amino acid transport system permease protein
MYAWYMAHFTLIISTLVNLPLAISIQVVLRAGVFSFASVGFYGIGAYAAGLMAKQGLGLAEILPIVIIGACLGGVLLYASGIGRLRGLYMGMATFAFALILMVVESNATSLTGGANGLIGVPTSLDLTEAVVISACVIILISQLERRGLGRILVTMRVSEEVASTSGVNIARYRRFIFTLSCALGALSGALYVTSYGAFDPTVAGFGTLNAALTMAVLGGVGSWIGALVGAIIVTWLPVLLLALGPFSNAIYGGLLVLVVMFAPQGITGVVGPMLRRGYRASVTYRRAGQGQASADPSAGRSIEPDAGLTGLTAQLGYEGDKPAATDGPAILRVENANLRFGGVHALDDVSLELSPATVYGLVGPNGSGKTTLIGAVSRLQNLDSGSLHFRDWEFTHSPPSETALRGVSRTFQSIQLIPGLTVLENVMVGGDLHWYGTGIVRSWLAPWWSRRKELELKAAAESALEIVDLTGVSGRYPETLSYGTRRRVEIARAVVRQPSILLLDEPTAGMNRAERDEIGSVLLRLRNQGIAIVLVEHDVEMVTRFCSQLYVLNFGRVIASGRPSECIRLPQVREAYLGRENDSAAERI